MSSLYRLLTRLIDSRERRSITKKMCLINIEGKREFVTNRLRALLEYTSLQTQLIIPGLFFACVLRWLEIYISIHGPTWSGDMYWPALIFGGVYEFTLIALIPIYKTHTQLLLGKPILSHWGIDALPRQPDIESSLSDKCSHEEANTRYKLRMLSTWVCYGCVITFVCFSLCDIISLALKSEEIMILTAILQTFQLIFVIFGTYRIGVNARHIVDKYVQDAAISEKIIREGTAVDLPAQIGAGGEK